MAFEVPDYMHERLLNLINGADIAVTDIRDAAMKKIEDASLPSAADRRRHALLQAAANIYGINGVGVMDSVTIAMALLAEIEKRDDGL